MLDIESSKCVYMVMLKKLNILIIALVLGCFVIAPQTSHAAAVGTSGTGGADTGGSRQNNIGDFLGPLTAGAANSRIPGFSVTIPGLSIELPGAAALTAAINAGAILKNLEGISGLPAILATVTAAFDDFPALLQTKFLDALLSSDLLPTEVTDLVDKFDGLKGQLEQVQNFVCDGNLNLGEHTKYLENFTISNINVKEITSSALPLPNFASDLTGKACGTLGAIPGINAGGAVPGVTNTPVTGPVPQDDKLNCSTSWQGPRDSLRDGNNPPGMANPELLNQIKRGAQELGMPPSYLAGVIMSESAGRPDAYNLDYAGQPACGPRFPASQSSATGLIQFLRGTADEIGLYSPPSTSCLDHTAKVRALSIAEQMDGIVRYYKKRGWEAGMTPYQAYATVHHGNPYGSSTDGANASVSTQSYFNGTVKRNMEIFECGGFDWANTLDFVEGA